jgi:biopolymer transport protein ExbD
MRRHAMPEMKEGGVNVTPLIDIVMCLIIFFMLVAKIGVARTTDQVDLPATIIGQMIKDMSNTVTINIHPRPGQDPQVVIGDHEVPLHDNNGGTPLLDVLKKFHDTTQLAAKERKVIIRADQGLEYRQLEPVLMAIAGAALTNVAYETNTPKAVPTGAVAEANP